MPENDQPRNLDPSALGTKDYWDNIYTVEIANHATNPEDEGTIWFEDSAAEEKMLEYLEALDFGTSGGDLPLMERVDFRILDLGTGNGHMLFALRDEGWVAELVGVDYSQKSVDLACQVQTSKSMSKDISFHQWDILKDPPGEWLFPSKFDIVLDKGTFDAISLSEEADASGNRVFSSYPDRVAPLIRQGGYLLITSCNWTEDELRHWFEKADLEYYGTVKFPSYTFGGVKGQTVSCICFKRPG